MKNKILSIITFVCGVMLTFSCTDELEQVNPNEITTDSFWEDLVDCESGVTSIYNAFKNSSIMALGDESNRSDMTWPGWGRPNTSNEYYMQTFTNSSSTVSNKWNALYTGIFRANQTIVALENLKDDPTTVEETWNELYGQARFFRGLFYFYLHNSFNKGSVVIYDFVPETAEEFFRPLSSADEVFDFFMADLKASYQEGMLPVEWENANDQGRVTRGTASAVIGKAYLYAEQYDSAQYYFEDVVNNYNYSLVDFSENITTNGELNAESILEVIYSLNYNTEESVWGNSSSSTINNMITSPVGGWRSCLPSCWITMAYKTDSIDVTDPRNYITETLETGVDTSYLRDFNLRASYSLALADDQSTEYYQYWPYESAQFNNKEYGYYRKHSNWDIYETEKDGVQSGDGSYVSGINYRVIRLADIYLMLAECYIKGGTDETGVDNAILYINRVRQRSALQLLGTTAADPDYPSADHNEKSYTAQEVMNHLMYVERPLELAMEGHAIRNIDLRRWGIKKERFEDLASRNYYVDNYPYQVWTGTEYSQGKLYSRVAEEEVTKWGAILYEGDSRPYLDVDDASKLQDFAQAASNYDEDAHAYWPIPASEEQANPKLYD